MPRTSSITIATALLILAVGMGIYALIFEPNNLQVLNLTVAFRDLPAHADGLVIAHVSDLHLHHIRARERKVLTIIRGNPPDIIALTGDMISRSRDKDECIEFLAGLKAHIGIWAVQGNWEHYTGWVGGDLRKDLAHVGIRLLINDAESVQLGGDKVWIAGTDDPSLGLDRLDQSLSRIEDGFAILLAHSPEIMNRAPSSVRLILSGHTHGGQVRIPLLGAPWAKRMGGGYLSGLYKRNQTVLYVTNGVGMTQIPIRFLCPPDITYITLRRSAP